MSMILLKNNLIEKIGPFLNSILLSNLRAFALFSTALYSKRIKIRRLFLEKLMDTKAILWVLALIKLSKRNPSKTGFNFSVQQPKESD